MEVACRTGRSSGAYRRGEVEISTKSGMTSGIGAMAASLDLSMSVKVCSSDSAGAMCTSSGSSGAGSIGWSAAEGVGVAAGAAGGGGRCVVIETAWLVGLTGREAGAASRTGGGFACAVEAGAAFEIGG